MIFARGPAAWYHLIQWNTEKDSFQHGHWFKGRIYPENCDLSPDGSLLLYFAHQGRRLNTSSTHAWTGLSRAPWLSTLGLWPNGSTWGGGGRFISNRSIILRSACGTPKTWQQPEQIEVSFGHSAHHKSSELIADAEWSGRDQNGRLIFTRDGKVFVQNEHKQQSTELVDFNTLTPTPEPAPESALEPLGSTNRKRRKPHGR